MKLKRKNILLILCLVVAIVYYYLFVDGLEYLYKMKPLILGFVALYYAASVSLKNINIFFSTSLLFLFCETLLAFFSDSNDLIYILSLGFALLFVLMNMILVSNMIGEIKTSMFFKIVFPTVFALSVIAYLIFQGGGLIIYLFYVFAVVIALYSSFSVYLFYKKRNKVSLLNLIAVLLFLFSAITRALNKMDQRMAIYEILNVIFFTSYLFLIAKAVILFSTSENKDISISK